jgi:hypothetical protein
MKLSKFAFVLATFSFSSTVVLLGGCANPYDINACQGGRYQPPHYGTYPNSSYYDNDYDKNFVRDHFGRAYHR